MLSNLCTEKPRLSAKPMVESRYDRNEEEDLKTAISYLYDFKKQLDKLHPNCLHLIQSMLQDQRRY